jgi:hypothetical protein
MSLLSKHTINLNSLNLTEKGNTILHSAAMSNDVKMIEFILQRISSSTIERMKKMKNIQTKLPSDYVTRWTPSTHSLFPLKFRKLVKAVLMLAAKRQDGTPYYPQTGLYKLPKDVLFIILQFVLSTGRPKELEETSISKSRTRSKKKRHHKADPTICTSQELSF